MLEVVERAGTSKKGYALWLCVCECGNSKVVRSDKLNRFGTRSCGCLMVETFRQPKIKHGLSRDPLYTVWRGMKLRCYNTNHKGFKDYGGRGIIVCEMWKSDFKKFYEWCTKNGYKKGLEIDRIDNDGIYKQKTVDLLHLKRIM